MALKTTLTTEEHAALPDALKAEYTAHNGGFALQLAGVDLGALQSDNTRMNAELAAHKTAAEKQAKEIADAKHAAAVAAGNVAEVERGLTEKHAKELGESNAALERLRGSLKVSALNSAVGSLVGKLSDHTELLSPHVRSRLTAEIDASGSVSVKVLDAAGNVSSATVEDLEKEFASNKAFSSIIRASRSTGSGAGNGNKQQNARFTPATDSSGKPVDLSKLDPQEMKARIEARKAGR